MPKPPTSLSPSAPHAGAAHWLPALAVGLGLVASTARASFLDESSPARSAALGGSSAASPTGAACLSDNPSALALCDSYGASARYQRLLGGLGGDDLGAGAVALWGPAGTWGGWGASWDHFGADHLQRDRLRLAGARSLPTRGLVRCSLGLSLSFLSQRYTLSELLPGIGPDNLSATALSFGAGILLRPTDRLTLAVSGDDLTRPNLGVVGGDRFDPSLHLGAAYRWTLPRAGRLEALVGAYRLAGRLEPQGGLEWTPLASWAFRAGARKRAGSLGFGFSRGSLSLDYAYVFSIGDAASLDDAGLPPDHLLELGWRWGGRYQPEDPDSFPALLRKADAESASSHWNEALWTYRRALLKSPGDPSALAGWHRALAAYNHERAEAYVVFAHQAESSGLTAEAQRDYEWALQLEGGHPEAQAGLARVKSQAPTGALADARVLRALQEAAALSAQGRRAEASKRLAEAKALHPGDPALDNLIQVLTAAPVTQTVVQTVVQSDPAVERLLAEAEIYQRKGRGDLAVESWRKILSVDPKNTEASGRLKAARSEKSTERSVSPANRRLAQELYEKGLRAYLDGDVREAIQDWESALARDPGHENALNNLARARLEVSHGATGRGPAETSTPLPKPGGPP